jgi:hypothetical protein
MGLELDELGAVSGHSPELRAMRALTKRFDDAARDQRSKYSLSGRFLGFADL